MILLLLLCSFGASIDCPNLINFARGMNMHLVQPAMMTKLINFDCCNSVQNPTIGCTAARVRLISWVSLNLNGTLNMTAFPGAATFINMEGNTISGNISVIPDRISNYYATNNKFSGILPALPTDADTMTFEYNLFNGSLPKFPLNIRHFAADGNAFTGSIPTLPVYLNTLLLTFNQLTQLPPSFPALLSTIYLNDNLLVGSIPAPLLESIVHLTLENNQLSGSIPKLPSSLVTLDIRDNNFTGVLPTLPYDIEFIYIGPGNQLSGSVNVSKPSVIDLRDNYIYDLTIKDRSSLVICNLDNTALFGKVNALTMCSRLGLVSFTSNVPKTPTYTSTYEQGITSSPSSTINTTANIFQSLYISQSRTVNQTAHTSFSTIVSQQTTYYIQMYYPETTADELTMTSTYSTSASIKSTEYLSSTLKHTTTKLGLQTSKLTIKAKTLKTNSVFIGTTSVVSVDINNNAIAVQPITPFLIIKLLCDCIVFLCILKTIFRLKKIRKHAREYSFKQSDYTQPSANTSVH